MRVVFFDTETTGTDPENDRIVEICLMERGAPVETFRVNPGVPIPAAATAVHGITDADVKDAPAFADIAPKVQSIVEGAVLAGYNSRSFDTPLLHAELRRAGLPGIDLDTVEEIDVLRVWRAIEPRTLTGAVARWLDRDHADAHAAEGDVDAVSAVWNAIADARDLSLADAIRISKPANEVDRAGKFVQREDGEIVLTFGKHKNVPGSELPLDYLQWMMNAEFPGSTKAVAARLIMERSANKRA